MQEQRKEQKNAQERKTVLKALDTFGNCQRPMFSLGVSQHMPVKIWAQLVVEVVRALRKKKHLCHTSCVLSDALSLS